MQEQGYTAPTPIWLENERRDFEPLPQKLLDAFSKIIDLIPEIMNKFKANKEINETAVKNAREAVSKEFDEELKA